VLSALFPWLPDAPAQTLAAKPLDDFQETVRKSGLIFEGIVTSIQPEWGAGRAKSKTPLSYRVSFQVKQSVRGVRAGTPLVIREWAGLWPARAQHYRMGEHVFMFLYPPSHGGLTSTVGGSKGKLTVSGAQVMLPLDWAQGASPIAAKSTSATGKIAPIQIGGVTVASLVQRIQQIGVVKTVVKTDVTSVGASASRSDTKGAK